MKRYGCFGARVRRECLVAGTVVALLASGCVPALQVRTERSGPRADPKREAEREPRVEFGAPSVEYSTDGQTLRLRATLPKRCATQVTTPQIEEVTETTHLGDSGHLAGNLGVAFSIALLGGLVALPMNNCGPDGKDPCSSKVNSDRATGGGVVASFAIIPLALEIYNQTRGGTTRTKKQIAPAVTVTPWKECGARPAGGALLTGALGPEKFSGQTDKNGEYLIEISDAAVQYSSRLTVLVDGKSVLKDARIDSPEIAKRAHGLEQKAQFENRTEVKIRDPLKGEIARAVSPFTLRHLGYALMWVTMERTYPELYNDSGASSKAAQIVAWGVKSREKVARDIFLEFANHHLTVPKSLNILAEAHTVRMDEGSIEQTFRFDFEARNGFGAVVSESASVIVFSKCYPFAVTDKGCSSWTNAESLVVYCDRRSGLTSPCN